MANAPLYSPANPKLRRGYGLDPIGSDLPLGSALSLVIHGGILLAALFAWQVTPRVMPEEVIGVDVVSDNPSVLGSNTAPEVDKTGVDTPTPSPIPQETLAPQSETLPRATVDELPPPPTAPPLPNQAPELAPTTPRVTQPATTPPSPSPPQPTPQPRQAQPAAPSARPLPKPPMRPPPQVAPKTPPIAKKATRPAGSSTPPEFDLASAMTSASKANSGGQQPQLSAAGKAGKLGKAGGGLEATGDLEAVLRAKLKICWNPPADMTNAGQLVVVVSMDLGIDGTLLRPPVLVSPSSTYGASARLIVAMDEAMKAVRRCAPFALPPESYERWRQVRFRFDPVRMTRP